jgi:hypothetical protein
MHNRPSFKLVHNASDISSPSSPITNLPTYPPLSLNSVPQIGTDGIIVLTTRDAAFRAYLRQLRLKSCPSDKDPPRTSQHHPNLPPPNRAHTHANTHHLPPPHHHQPLLSSTSSHFRGPGSFSGSASGTGTRAGTGYGVKEECSSPVLTRYGGGGGAPV